MIKKARLALVTTSAILLAACTAPTQAPTDQKITPESGSEQGITASVRDLLGMGKNVKCTFSTSETDEDGVKTDTSGTVYISGKNMAEDVKVVSSDKEVGTVNMKMISDGTTIYSWNPELKTQGMKFKMMDETAAETSEPTKAQSQNANIDEKIDMKCSDWNVDNSVFSVPTDVKFSDLTEMMKNIPTMPANIPNYGGDSGE